MGPAATRNRLLVSGVSRASRRVTTWRTPAGMPSSARLKSVIQRPARRYRQHCFKAIDSKAAIQHITAQPFKHIILHLLRCVFFAELVSKIINRRLQQFSEIYRPVLLVSR